MTPHEEAIEILKKAGLINIAKLKGYLLGKPQTITIPLKIAELRGLAMLPKLLYGAIYETSRDGVCYETNEYLADLIGVKPLSIPSPLATLENKGYIKRKDELASREIHIVNGKRSRPKTDKEKTDPKKPMNLKEFIDWTKIGGQRHIELIGDYADEKKVTFTTYGQWQEFIKDNVAHARQLSPFDDIQISKALKKMQEQWDGKWTLLTVKKYLTDIK